MSRLTPRHREVLHLTALGYRASEAAKRLGIREGTVKAHLAEIRWRFNVQTTTRAVVLAIQSGELDPRTLVLNEPEELL